MKDLKENIQKNNMKKLVLSAVLGMLCYCTNNAMDPQENENQEDDQIYIEEILGGMLLGQAKISYEKKKITEEEKKNIYATIKGEQGGINIKKLVDFIKFQIGIKEKKDIEIIKNYFNIKKFKDDNDCFMEVFTDIFWDHNGKDGSVVKEKVDHISNYLREIIKQEKLWSKFSYDKFSYEFIENKYNKLIENNKINPKNTKKVEVIEKITQGANKILGDKQDQFVTNFKKQLSMNIKQTIEEYQKDESLYYEYICKFLQDNEEEIINILVKRIFKDEQNPTQKNFIDFLSYLYKQGELLVNLKPKKNSINNKTEKCCPCC